MVVVVFMRGVNVAGHKTFRSAAFAKELSAFDVVSVGAAGTFIVRNRVSQGALRADFLRRLPFKAEFMICRARNLLELAAGEPFPREASVKGVRRFVSVLAKSPPNFPTLPFSHPAGREWQVKLVGLCGRFALSLWRRTGRAMIYPNEVVEKRLAVAATTRTWDTIFKITSVLQGD